MHVILTNGAPFSGKDTFVKDFIKRYENAVWVRFKDVLYTDTYERLFGKNHNITFDEWVSICNNVTLKDKPFPKLNGTPLDAHFIQYWVYDHIINDGVNHKYLQTLSPRNELIFESENIIKVNHGEGGVAVRTAENIKLIDDWQNKVFIFSDGGFNVEINALIETLGITRDDITIIRITADGCTFDGDSREYLDNPNFIVHNPKTMKFFDVCEEAGIYKKADDVFK